MTTFTSMSFLDSLNRLQNYAGLLPLETLTPCLSGATVYGGIPTVSDAFDRKPVFLVEMNRLALANRFLVSTDARSFVRPKLLSSTESSPLAGGHLAGLAPDVSSAIQARLGERIEVRKSEKTAKGVFRLALNREDSFVLAFEEERPSLWTYRNNTSLLEDDYRSEKISKNFLLAGAFAVLPEATAQALLGAQDAVFYRV